MRNLLAGILFVACGANVAMADSTHSNITPEQLKPGQIYRYDNDATEPDSRVIILKMETLVAENRYTHYLLHVSVTNVMIKGKYISISHLPLHLDDAIKSLRHLEGVTNTPIDEYELKLWRLHFMHGEPGEAGYYGGTIGEAVNEVRAHWPIELPDEMPREMPREIPREIR